jgi:hypothetical protein
MSDSYFIGTVSRVHKLWRIPRPVPPSAKGGNGSSDSSTSTATANPKKTEDTVDDDDVNPNLRKEDNVSSIIRADVEQHAAEESVESNPPKPKRPRREVGMMVSLDHTIYFHDPRGFRADEWIFTENESTWAGDGRGLVFQKMWSRDGRLIASCVQEVSASHMFSFSNHD